MSDSRVSKTSPQTIRGGGPVGRSEPDVAVVCASNDPAVLERMLVASLERQTLRWELRVVDARAEGLTGCAAALNKGAADTVAPWLLFVHQDVAFDDPDFLKRAIEMMAALPDVAAAGPIGASDPPIFGRQRVVGRLLMGAMREEAGGIAVNQPTPVQTLDELMIFTPRNTFDRVRFDESACPDWHLYGVDYCLTAARAGGRTYVLPIEVHHLSGGTLNAGYYATLRRVVRKHRGRVRTISTTSEFWPTRPPTPLLKAWHLARVLARLTVNHVRGQNAVAPASPKASGGVPQR